MPITRSMTRNFHNKRRNTNSGEVQNENPVPSKHQLVSLQQGYDHTKGQHLALDKISNLPSTIIETILCLVPIKEAARTSILSREWRYKWTKIPELEFDEDAFEASADENQLSLRKQEIGQRNFMPSRLKLFYAIYQVLLVHQGPILKFTLYMNADETCVEIDHIINHLSRKNTVKKMFLYLGYSRGYRLPLSLFSLHQLTKLYILKCGIYHQPAFNGFGSLTTLYLHDVYISTKTLLHLLSGCPLLKSVLLFISEYNILGNDISTIIELFKCFPMIERLITWTWVTQCFVVDEVVPQELPTTLVHLKYFRIHQMCLFDDKGLPFLIFLIRCSPNLEKFALEIFELSATDPVLLDVSKEDPVTLDQDYPDTRLEHLKELEIYGFIDFKLHLEFVKFILAKSPVLKTVYLHLYEGVTKDEESNISGILLSCPRVSPVVEIILER